MKPIMTFIMALVCFTLSSAAITMGKTFTSESGPRMDSGARTQMDPRPAADPVHAHIGYFDRYVTQYPPTPPTPPAVVIVSGSRGGGSGMLDWMTWIAYFGFIAASAYFISKPEYSGTGKG